MDLGKNKKKLKGLCLFLDLLMFRLVTSFYCTTRKKTTKNMEVSWKKNYS